MMDADTPILIVDDYSTMLKIMANLLRQLGLSNIEEATNKEMAMDKLRQRAFGLVISDWDMGSMEALALLNAMRGEEELKDIPFIMVTDEGKREEVQAVKVEGLSTYIVKPFNALTLRSKIATVLEL